MYNLLIDRLMYCRGDSNASNSRLANEGLPQRSSSSPKLFNFYMSKLHQDVDGELFIYADDMALIITADDPTMLVEKTNRELDKLSKKLNSLGLTISRDKTKVMHVTRKRDKRLNVMLNGDNLEFVRSFKYLGIILEDTLNFSSFANEQANKADKKLNILRAIGGINIGSHPSTMLNVYKGIVRSQMEFGVFFLL